MLTDAPAHGRFTINSHFLESEINLALVTFAVEKRIVGPKQAGHAMHVLSSLGRSLYSHFTVGVHRPRLFGQLVHGYARRRHALHLPMGC